MFSGLLCDLLWSDPDKDVQGWGENDRGVSFTFGADVVSKFLNRHDLDLICRAHQVCPKYSILMQSVVFFARKLPKLSSFQCLHFLLSCKLFQSFFKKQLKCSPCFSPKAESQTHFYPRTHIILFRMSYFNDGVTPISPTYLFVCL